MFDLVMLSDAVQSAAGNQTARGLKVINAQGITPTCS
jgi:hypothetical protein